MAVPTQSPDLLIVGAGPTGLTAALAAVQAGLRVRIIDQRPARGTYSKALVTHARTMEIFASLGLAADIQAAGGVLEAINLRGSFGVRGNIALDELDWGDTAYPHWLIIPQYEVELVLEKALAKHDVCVEWGNHFQGLEQSASAVTSTVVTQDQQRTITSSWVIGADGGHSAVRDEIGSVLRRDKSDAQFLLADAYTTAHLRDQQAHIFLSPEGFLLLIPMPTHGLWRLIVHLPYETSKSGEPVTPELLNELVESRSPIHFGAHDIAWSSWFSPSYGVASSLRKGRVFLAGDAAHVHSPVGGQGMNFGVQDAHNLVWKLALANQLQPKVAEKLLKSYEAERRPVIQRMVGRVKRLTTLITDSRRAGRRVLGTAAPTLMPHTPARQVLGQAMGGLSIVYQHGPLVVGRDRLSGARAANSILQEHQPGTWQWHTGDNTVQLVRPDGIVAASGPTRPQIEKRLNRNPFYRALSEADVF